MATEELLKLIQENPMGYEGYLAYAKYLETINLKQAYLTYENALYFCDDETMKKTIQSKLDEIAYRNGKVEPASIVILSYNNRPLTQQCIESIRETTPEFAREIVIVDNNSQYVLAKELGGQMSGEHGTGNGRLSFLKDFVGDRMIDLYKQIKIAFDPNLILNPGKMIEFNEEDTNEK